MCGIVGVFNLKMEVEALRPKILEMSKQIRHRGPDWSGIYMSKNAIMAHERLSIVDPTSGKQPLYTEDGTLVLAVNGEIYNHQAIRKSLSASYNFLTHSDCEVILALYRQKGIDFLEDLNGIFAFMLYDETQNTYLVARDHIGIIPLYMGWDKSGNFYVASELKALEGVCNKIQEFPPGHYLHSSDGVLQQWYTRDWSDFDAVKDNKTDLNALKTALDCKFPITIITGGNSQGVIKRLNGLGITQIYASVKHKLSILEDLVHSQNLDLSTVAYMGDDLPDYECMRAVHLAACPADAVMEIKTVSQYISPCKGGEGCVRDLIEKVLKAQNKWSVVSG